MRSWIYLPLVGVFSMATSAPALTAAPAAVPLESTSESGDAEPDVPSVPGPSFQDVIGLEGVGGPAISPDGKAVAYTVGTTDWEENRFDTEIWLWREERGSIQLTRNPDDNSRSPRWSPDGHLIAFVSDRGSKTQVHAIPFDGGEAWALTDEEEGVGNFRWSPDGKSIAYTRRDEKSHRAKGREEQYGAFSIEDQDLIPSHLWTIDVKPPGGGATDRPEPKRLTEGDDFTVGSFAWSPDGTRIAFDHRPRPVIDDFVHSDLSVVEVASEAVTRLVEAEGPDNGPIWSPDGRFVLYSSPMGANSYYGNKELVRIPLAGGKPETLTAGFDEDPRAFDWTDEGIWFVGGQRTEIHLFRLDPESGEITRVEAELPMIFSVDLASASDRLAFAGSDPTRMSEIYLANRDGSGVERVTAMTDQVIDWELGTREVIEWKSRDGASIEGVLFVPEDHDTSKPAPLLVVIHGGPTGTSRPTLVSSYVYPVTQWLAKGALVLMPNYRGSAGYGEAFRSLNVRNLGVGDAWDVLSAVDHLVDRGFADPDMLGAMGWSQGGYISAFLTTTTDRFRAISNGAGISNWMTYYVNTDIHGFTRQYLKATPWDDPEVYAKTSPMTYIKGASTPTLIQHGENDARVPIPNAYELYQGLQDVGVDTRLIVYKDFGHGITKPKERLAAQWHNWQWFAKYLWGEEVELPIAEEDEEDEDGDEED